MVSVGVVPLAALAPISGCTTASGTGTEVSGRNCSPKTWMQKGRLQSTAVPWPDAADLVSATYVKLTTCVIDTRPTQVSRTG